MDELEKQMTILMDSLNQAWIDEDRKSKNEERYLDGTVIMGKYSEIVNQVKDAFGTARVRMGLSGIPKRKKGFFK